jgi:hypothetical protein
MSTKTINIRKVDGKIISIEVNEKDTILEIKKKLVDEDQVVYVKLLRPKFPEFSNELSVSECNIMDGETLIWLFRHSG